MAASQLVFDIALHPSYAPEDFVPGPANASALELAQSLAWPTPLGLIVGQTGAGKTHLARIFAHRFAKTHAFDGSLPSDLKPGEPLIIDGLEQWASKEQEDTVFHALEAARRATSPVLVTSQTPPETLGFGRPDTVSRLRAGARATIDSPDDDLFQAIAIKLFADRQLLVDPAVAHYLLTRMERSYGNLAKLTALIDERALSAGRSITKPLARDVLSTYDRNADAQESSEGQ